MKTKSSLINIFIIVMLIAGLTLGFLFIHYGAKDTAYEQYKAQNNCPYEFGECPSTQQIMKRDSIDYCNLEYVTDSLASRIIQLETQLAGCEYQDHSKLVSH